MTGATAKTQIRAVIRRDLRLVWGRGSEGLATVGFFVLACSLFGFALGDTPTVLQQAAPALVWVTVMLAALLALESIYHRDAADGTLDLLLLTPLSAPALMAAKTAAHWLAAGLPLVLAAGIAGPMLQVPLSVLPVLLLSLTLGTVYISLLGAFAAALTLGARRPGVLMALIVLPLCLPALVPGLLAVSASLAGLAVRPYVLLQLALVLAALPLAPFAAGKCLHLHLRSLT